MKKITIGNDVDGVLHDCEGYALTKINQKYGTNYREQDVKVYGYTDDAIINEKFKYYPDPAFVMSQPCYEGAKEFVKEEEKRGKLYYCTAVDVNCLTVRAAALKRDFDAKPEQIIMASDKSLIRFDYFLDDNPENIRNSTAKYPVLFRRPWNHDVTGAMAITKYEDFLCFIDYNEQRTPFREIPKTGAIICLVGPSGAGKGNVVDMLCKKRGYETIKTYTSGGDPKYINISSAEFAQKESLGFFAETTVYGGVSYGISKESLINTEDKNIVLPVDMCGAMGIKNLYGDRVVIVFCEEDKEIIIANLLKKKIPEEEIIKRLSSIDVELSNKQFCDFAISGAAELLNQI